MSQIIIMNNNIRPPYIVASLLSKNPGYREALETGQGRDKTNGDVKM